MIEFKKYDDNFEKEMIKTISNSINKMIENKILTRKVSLYPHCIVDNNLKNAIYVGVKFDKFDNYYPFFINKFYHFEPLLNKYIDFYEKIFNVQRSIIYKDYIYFADVENSIFKAYSYHIEIPYELDTLILEFENSNIKELDKKIFDIYNNHFQFNFSEEFKKPISTMSLEEYKRMNIKFN